MACTFRKKGVTVFIDTEFGVTVEDLQIQLLYCQYGWLPSRIATAINKPETYIKKVIEENDWKLPEKVESNLVPIEGQDPSNTAIQELKDNEVRKQAVLAPLVAIAEIALLGKITETIDHFDTTEDGAGVKLANLVKAFKAMQQDTVVTKVVNNEADAKPGIAIQVITQIV